MMSLTIRSRCSAALQNRLDEFALFVVDLGSGQQVGNPDDRIHGRADLVTHVGQEL
jgi:hypothetical protein